MRRLASDTSSSSDSSWSEESPASAHASPRAFARSVRSAARSASNFSVVHSRVEAISAFIGCAAAAPRVLGAGREAELGTELTGYATRCGDVGGVAAGDAVRDAVAAPLVESPEALQGSATSRARSKRRQMRALSSVVTTWEPSGVTHAE